MKKLSLYAMSALYILAGINHFWHQDMYLQIMPAWIGNHELLVIISGICEIFFGVLLLPLATRRFAAIGIILLLIVVFPANIQMMINYSGHYDIKWWISVIRLPLQLVLIWWAYTFARNTGLKEK